MVATSPNRAYLASANAFAQILLRRVSDARGTLRELRGECDGESEKAEC